MCPRIRHSPQHQFRLLPRPPKPARDTCACAARSEDLLHRPIAILEQLKQYGLQPKANVRFAPLERWR
eukprot:2828659-Prorocentrum_lima.AAC.1